ncbi:TPA: hypothetical protein ACIS4Z_004094, partial [Salmonella enterica subsp. enterica serovar Liverpool]
MSHVQLVVHMIACYIFVTAQTAAGRKPRSPARPRRLRGENFFSFENCRKEAPEQAKTGFFDRIRNEKNAINCKGFRYFSVPYF